MRGMTRTLLAAAALGAALAPASVLAQEAERTRQGFWFSGGLGWGGADCEQCEDGRVGGGAAVLALGGTLSQRLLLGASANAWARTEDEVTIALSALTAMVRFYPSRTGGFHLSAGLGVSSRSVEVEGGGVSVTVSENGTAALLGTGYDFRVGRNVSLTPFANLVGADFDGQGTGFTQVGLAVTVH